VNERVGSPLGNSNGHEGIGAPFSASAAGPRDGFRRGSGGGVESGSVATGPVRSASKVRELKANMPPAVDLARFGLGGGEEGEMF